MGKSSNFLNMTALLLLALGVFLLTMEVTSASVSEDNSPPPNPSFVAAVYEHVGPRRPSLRHFKTRQNALDFMFKSLRVYRDQTRKARQQGADIIVFPEDGIHGTAQSRRSIGICLEQIPDPETIHWSPCLHPERFPNTDVLHALSCMALESEIYLVANMGDFVPCDGQVDPKCPKDGHYQFNTNVAFGPAGTLLAKYHKRHLYHELQFDTPESKVVFFDTPFGRFGMMICFDILFEDPAVKMVVSDYNITNIAFSTAWIDKLPLFSAIGFHSSFARGLGVNFLAANLRRPRYNFQGSGIYTPKGMATFYYNNSMSSPGKLLVSTIETIPPASRRLKEVEEETNPTDENVNTDDDFTPNAGSDDSCGVNKDYDQEIGDGIFKSQIFHDMFNFRLLDESSGNLSVCHRNVCCAMSYTFGENPQSEMFAFGAFDGFHDYGDSYWFQICTVLKCADGDNKLTCGSPAKESTTTFSQLSISGRFQTKFVYPQVLLTDSEQQLSLANESLWTFHRNAITTASGFERSTLLSATLFGRLFDRDDGVIR